MTETKRPATGAFRSFGNSNYRLWAGGSLVSYLGTWMQRIAQDWLVLTQLTHNSATTLGVVVAMQFAPLLLLLPLTGYAADHLDRRKLLITTQGAMAALALGLGLLVVTGLVQLWHVYVFALLFGCVAAFDAPATQTFAADLVGESDLSNAVALNTTSFNAARLIGPAIASLLIGAIGSGWVLIINAATYAAVIFALGLIRVDGLYRDEQAPTNGGSLVEGFAYVWARQDLKAVLLMLFLFCTFGLNFPVFISSMSINAFNAGASGYGLLMSALGAGAIGGGLFTAGRSNPDMTLLMLSATTFGIAFALAAIAPTFWLFGVSLLAIGASAVIFTASTNSLMQLSSASTMRGRVMAIRLAIALGGMPIGAPIVGWVADYFGPRWALGVAAASGLGAALVGARYLARRRHWQPQLDGGAGTT